MQFMQVTSSPSLRIALRAFTRPWVLACATVLLVAPTGWARWGGIGIASDSGGVMELSYELAFLGGLLGAIVGTVALEGWTWLLRRFEPGDTLRLEAAVITATTGGLASLPLLTGIAVGSTLRPVPSAALVLGLVQIVCAALAARRLPVPAAHPVLLLACCWWIPAALAPSFPFGLGLAPRALASAGGAGPALQSPAVWVAGAALLLAFALAARLGLGRAARRP